MTLHEVLCERGCAILRHTNKLKIPVYVLGITEEGATQFNLFYDELRNSTYNKIVRTPSGGISINKSNFRPPMWDVSYTFACIELTIVAMSKMLRIQFRQDVSLDADGAGEQRKIYGRQAITEFKKQLLRDGIDLDAYAIDNGMEVKKSVPKYIIRAANKYVFGEDKVFENCHHIDFHNSFPAGLINTHPEFAPTITRLYEARKEKPIYKAVLNYSIGFFQSEKGCQARWCHLAKDAIADNNARLLELSQKLADSGRRVLLWNTDGIWYQGDIYHGEGEGSKLGEWENDHVNCRLRAKSEGAYEFIEGDKYYPVLRGYTKLDKQKPRDKWEWGDIFHLDSAVIHFYWNEEEGITNEEGEKYM